MNSSAARKFDDATYCSLLDIWYDNLGQFSFITFINKSAGSRLRDPGFHEWLLEWFVKFNNRQIFTTFSTTVPLVIVW